MNLYNFYNIVKEKISALLQESFMLDNAQLRLPLSEFGETIRECMVNCLAHADYTQGYPSVKIDAYDGWFSFLNPGKMLVSIQQFQVGGDSRPRNEIVMKLFRLLGASERQGFGGPLIFKTALQNDFRSPEIMSNLERTEIKVWNIDLSESYPELEDDEKQVLKYILKTKEPISAKSIWTAVGITEYRLRKILPLLEKMNLVQKSGNGSATKYSISVKSIEKFTQLQIMMDSLKKFIS